MARENQPENETIERTIFRFPTKVNDSKGIGLISQVFRVPTLVGFFHRDKSPTRVGTLNAGFPT
jgi:hypothetical protein